MRIVEEKGLGVKGKERGGQVVPSVMEEGGGWEMIRWNWGGTIVSQKKKLWQSKRLFSEPLVDKKKGDRHQREKEAGRIDLKIIGHRKGKGGERGK